MISPLVILALPFVLFLYCLTGMSLFSISHLFLSLGSYPRNTNPDLWIFFSTHHTSHGKKYIALYVCSRIEPGSQMARAPTRTAETVGTHKCSVHLKIRLEVTVLKGHCHWYLKCLQYTSGLQNFLKV